MGAQTDRVARAASRPTPSRPRSSATATRSSRPTRSTSRRQPVRRDGRHAGRGPGGHAPRAGACSGVVNVVGSTHRPGRATAASTCTRARRSRSPRRRRSPARLVALRAAGAAARAHPRPRAPPTAQRLIAALGGCPPRSRRSSRTRRRSPTSPTEFAGAETRVLRRARPRATRSRSRARQKLKEISYVHAEAYPTLRAQARPARADRARPADGGDRPRRRPARQEPLDGRADPRARRPRRSWSATSSLARPGRPRVLGSRAQSPSSTRSCSASPCSCWPTTRPCALGRDVDQPRNLAKSVTVE